MSEPAAKRKPIDLDEFDRRLRIPAAQRPDSMDDPLAELARLVGGSADPFAPLFASGRPEARPGAGAFRQAQPANAAPPPAPDQAPSQAFSAPTDDFALRTGFQDADPAAWEQNDPAAAADPRGYAPGWDAKLRNREQARARRSVLLMSGALAVVFAGVAWTLAVHDHIGGFGKPPLILADAKPYKIKPPATPPRDRIEDSTTLLNKGDGDPKRPAHIVNTEEEPVDLALAAPDKDAPAAAAADGSNSPFPKPRPVKTILVRPDGTVISQGDDGTAASAGAPPSTDDSGAPSPSSATPSAASDAPAPSSGSRAAAPSAPSFATVVDQAASNSDSQASAPPPPESGNPQPSPPAESAAEPPPPAAPAPAAAAAAPAAPQDATQSADLSEDAGAPAASETQPAPAGGWSVQLAAPATEREAHLEIERLEKRFASQLGARKLISFAAQSNGRSVWRVRVAGLARADALSLCGRIKSGGGACFVAKN